jgi:hypothetical protein
MNQRHIPDRVTVAAAIEVVTGLVLIVHPPLFGWLLFGAEFSPPGQALGRLAGFALLALALACWAGVGPDGRPALRALLVFSILTTLYLAFVGVGGVLVGILLWPAAILHATLTILLGRAWFTAAQ